jgi:hypothetical protein
VKVAVTVVAVATMLVTLIFGAVTEVTPARLVPVRTTVVEAPALAEAGVVAGTVAMLVSAGRTVNVCPRLVPPGLVTVMLFGPAVAAERMLRDCVSEVAAALTTGSPLGVKFAGGFTVASNRSVPVRVTVTVVLAAPVTGEMPVSTGGAAFTVKGRMLLVPLGVVMVRLRAPRVVMGEIAKLAVVEVPAALIEAPVPPVMVMPDIRSTAPLPMLAPAMTTGTVRPRKPELGITLVNAGGPMRTVKLEPAETALAPAVVFTVMAQGPNGPTGLTENVAVIWVRLTTVTLPGTTAPEAQVDTTNDVGRKPVPVMVTALTELSGAWVGDIEVMVGSAVLAPSCHRGPASAAKIWPWPSAAKPLMELNTVGTPAITPVSAIVA